jgi:hypothetical protein
MYIMAVEALQGKEYLCVYVNVHSLWSRRCLQRVAVITLEHIVCYEGMEGSLHGTMMILRKQVASDCYRIYQFHFPKILRHVATGPITPCTHHVVSKSRAANIGTGRLGFTTVAVHLAI